uniref:Putative jasmonate O-methyltransferase n=1 Tax=Oryza minuta TaxID=63629 RepID=G9C303_ORYMI|nr:putative jasmonate O-methyltransferase [Oryza minuta]
MQEQQQHIKNVFCMEGGQGESSYINNSQSQSRNLKMMLYALEETLDKVQLVANSFNFFFNSISLGRRSSTHDPTEQGYIYEVYGGMFEESWRDLIEEGMVDDEKMDSFNVPLYAATVEEFKEAVDADGSFKINQLELVMGSPPVVDDPADRSVIGRMVANYVRALLGPLIDTHIGGAMADELFIRMQHRAEIRAEELVDEMCFPHILCSLSLA